MSVLEITMVVVFGAFLGTIYCAWVIDAVRGTDIKRFERLRRISPRRYRSIRLNGQGAGFLMVIFSTVTLIASPMLAFGPDGSWQLACGLFVLFALNLWLSLRWWLWARNAPNE